MLERKGNETNTVYNAWEKKERHIDEDLDQLLQGRREVKRFKSLLCGVATTKIMWR